MRFHVEHAWLGVVLLALPCAAAEVVSVRAPDTLLPALYYAAPPKNPGPAPAVVMLHGCSGMWSRPGVPTASNADWARRLGEAGFAVLMLDSFGSRGEREICTQATRAIRPERERTTDAHAARLWLAARADVDSSRIHLLGWSNGGSTVLHAIKPDAAGSSQGPPFRSAVAFYPGCGTLGKKPYRAAVPLLIQAGGADDWTPAERCVALARAATGPSVEIDVYPEAHHAFDRLGGQVRFRPQVRNPASKTGWGATIGPHPEARARAIERTLKFLGNSPDVPRGTQ
jgi:dienelactone hydrolase